MPTLDEHRSRREDEELVRRLRDGDMSALDTVWRKYGDDLFKAALVVLGDPNRTQDAVTEAILEAHRSIHQLKDPHALRPWLTRIAARKAQRERASLRRQQPSELPDDRLIAETGEQGFDAAMDAWRNARVTRAMAGLKEDDRLALFLRFWQDRKVAEIADVLAVTPVKAEKDIERARERLERSLRALVLVDTQRGRCPALDGLLRHWDGRLTPLLRKQLARHADRCPDCRPLADESVRAEQMIAALPPLAIPVAVKAGVAGGLAHASSATTTSAGHTLLSGFPAPWWARRPIREALSAGLAGVAATVAIFVVLNNPGTAAASWTRITPNMINFAEVGYVRGNDGALHVVWSQNERGESSLKHQTISRDGAVGEAPTSIATGWHGITSNPSIVSAPDGRLHAFFAGRSPSNDLLGVATAASDSGGRTWGAARPVSTGAWAYVAEPGAGLTAKSDPVVAWTTISHRPLYRFLGATPASPEVQFAPGCCVRGPKIVTDAVRGETVLGWYWTPLGEGKSGFYVRPIAPTGPLGPALRAPGAGSATQRAAITARLGRPGIFLAYVRTDGKAIELWRYGTRTARVVARGTDLDNVGIAAAPEGRVWVFWESGERYYAMRSNREATGFEHAITVAPPPGSIHTTYSLSGEASLGTLDLLAHVQTSPRQLATWHRRVVAH
jgi:RNA polymerase sigma factor (sigma-70 family)